MVLISNIQPIFLHPHLRFLDGKDNLPIDPPDNLLILPQTIRVRAINVNRNDMPFAARKGCRLVEEPVSIVARAVVEYPAVQQLPGSRQAVHALDDVNLADRGPVDEDVAVGRAERPEGGPDA